MSWIDKIQEELSITTGDGSVFSVLWKPTTYQLPFNVTSFEFPNTEGTLVKRKKPKGVQYGVEFYFTGADHLEQASAFKLASKNPKAWVISHPFYGRLVVQPTRLRFDDKDMNVTKVTGVVIETIEESGFTSAANPANEITEKSAIAHEAGAQNFNNADTDSTNLLQAQNEATFSNFNSNIETPEDANKLNELYSAAKSGVNGALQDPVNAMRQTQALLNLPVQITGTWTTRYNLLERELSNLLASVSTLGGLASKKAVESKCASLISAQAELATVASFETRVEVLSATTKLADDYDLMLTALDTMQDADYFANHDLLIRLDDLVNYTITHLLQIATEAKQEREIILSANSNVILLAHKYFSPQPDDSHIDDFINTNAVGLNEILELKKGRKIVYFV